MGYLYIMTLIFLGFGFILFEKSEKKLNIIKWICLYIVGIFAYNITLCMLLGILHITQNICFLSTINLIIGSMLLYKPIRYHKIQKYKCSKKDIFSIIFIFIVFAIMFVKDLYIFEGDVTHFAVDSAVHYRAAKHYSENMQLFVFTQDKTFFDFNIMQTGAYINDGILMNVINDITGMDKIYIYQLFETISLFVSGLAIYVFFADKMKTKRGVIGSLLLFVLYMYGYPYNSWIYGFSYLTVGISMVTLLLSVVEMLFSEDNINKTLVVTMIVLTSMGVIFSYCLFVPVVFSAICIYVFLTELKEKNKKKYLKIFGKNTLIITGILLIITAFGIGYLFIPSFFIEGQTDLVTALQDDGGIYTEKYKNFIPYIPILIIYIFELARKIKNKELEYVDVFTLLTTGYLILFYAGMLLGKVSPYYMLKIYFIIWIALFAITIEILNKHINDKLFRIDAIILVMLFGFLAIIRVSSESIFRIYLLLLLTLFTTLPEIVKSIDFTKFKILPKKYRKNIELNKIRVTPFVYTVALFCFIFGWATLKSANILSEEHKHFLMNLVGMYYSEDCEYRKAIDVTQNFNKNNILITKYARENLDDMTADNTILITKDFYKTIWAIATLEYSSENITFRHIINETNHYEIEDGLNNEKIKYIIRLDSRNQDDMEKCKSSIEELEKNDSTEVLYSNENGYVAKINR